MIFYSTPMVPANTRCCSVPQTHNLREPRQARVAHALGARGRRHRAHLRLRDRAGQDQTLHAGGAVSIPFRINILYNKYTLFSTEKLTTKKYYKRRLLKVKQFFFVSYPHFVG